MDRFVRGVARSWIITLNLCGASLVHAQSLEATPAPLEPAGSALFTPPELLEPVEPDYPASARAGRLAATVLLQLSIDSAGKVTEAVVLESAGHGFDEAAQAAASRLRFAPARYRDRQIAGMVRHRFRFEPPPAPPASELLAPGVTRDAAAPPPAEPLPEMAVGGGDEIVVVGQALSAAQQLQQSAEAVQVSSPLARSNTARPSTGRRRATTSH